MICSAVQCFVVVFPPTVFLTLILMSQAADVIYACRCIYASKSHGCVSCSSKGLTIWNTSHTERGGGSILLIKLMWEKKVSTDIEQKHPSAVLTKRSKVSFTVETFPCHVCHERFCLYCLKRITGDVNNSKEASPVLEHEFSLSVCNERLVLKCVIFFFIVLLSSHCGDGWRQQQCSLMQTALSDGLH